MKSNLLVLIFLTFLVTPTFSQHVEMTHLHDFVNLGYPTGLLINTNGELVQIRNEYGVAVFTIFDTSNYQVLHQISPSNQNHGGIIINNFVELNVHTDSGYLVAGAIPIANNAFSTPIIYWIDENANIIKSYEGPHSIPSDLGIQPIFNSLFTRSDGHIIALYSALNRSTINDTGLISIIYEFDNLLNLIDTDTLSTNSSLGLTYNQSNEEIILTGTSYSNNPWAHQSYFSTIDAFSFTSITHVNWPNRTEYLSKIIMTTSHAFILANQVTYTPQYSSKIAVYKFNLGTQTIEDSIIFTHDSILFQSYYLNIVDSNLFLFLTETDFRKNNSNQIDNHFIVLDDTLVIKVDSTINDSNERYVSSQYFNGTDLFFSYGKNTNPTFTYVFMKVSLNGITSVLSIQKNENEWLVYPNPTSGTLRFNIPLFYKKASLHYRLYNVTGTLIEISQLISNTIDINNLPKGLYILTVSDNNQILFTTKISKH